MIRHIVLGGRRLEYELTRKNVKNINLRIKPDLSISVSASSRVTVAQIEDFMRANEKAILGALDKFSQGGAVQEKPQYVSGELVSVLGIDYELCVEKDEKNIAFFNISHESRRIIISVTDVSNLELRRKTLEKLLKNNLREVLIEPVGRLYPLFEQQGVAYPEIRIRTMSSKWGSCMPKKGVLTFSTNLLAAPLECIEYVVAHEFTHFLHPDHSKSFYAGLEKVCPDWKMLKKRLENYRVIRKQTTE